ncbi:hypothetical protein [Nocardia sp. NBC_00511]|uniref:hypothetical protein n=1 Tax=Nocardia sp. NBC_00511 TaxID=2903591 RepID=UPI0030E13572
MAMDNAGTAERLIDYERVLQPSASHSMLIDLAIKRIRDDIRRKRRTVFAVSVGRAVK